MKLLDLIFPSDIYCISCGRPMHGEALCKECEADIQWVDAAGSRLCAKCGKPLADENTKDLCRDCAETEHLFGTCTACVRYAGRAKNLVRDMKYHGKSWFAGNLAQMMARRFFETCDAKTGELRHYDLVTNVPMSRRKKVSRGYDQAELLARRFASEAGIPFAGEILVRRQETAAMSNLSLGARRQNLAAAICPAQGLPGVVGGKSILVVDDVFTTGSSADACTEVLLEAGAANVDIFVFAIGADGRATMLYSV